MALTVSKRRMTDIKLVPEDSSVISSGKLWCYSSESDERLQSAGTLLIPETPISKLKATFPTLEDKYLEEALNCCNKNIKAASAMIQRERLEKLTISDQQMEDKKTDALPMVGLKQKRSSIIKVYLDRMEKVQNREEAYKLTELLLKRYKGDLKSGEAEKMNDTTTGASQERENKVLKKGMQILVQRYNALQQNLQKEQEKAKEVEKKCKATQSEVTYYKTLVGTLANKLRNMDCQNMDTGIKWNPNPDVY